MSTRDHDEYEAGGQPATTATAGAPSPAQRWQRLRETARTSAEYASVMAIVDDETLGLRGKVMPFTQDGIDFPGILGDPVELEEYERSTTLCRRCGHAASTHATSPSSWLSDDRVCFDCPKGDEDCYGLWLRDHDPVYLSGGERALVELAAGLWNGRRFDITDVLCRLGDYHLEVAFRAMRIRAGLETLAGAR